MKLRLSTALLILGSIGAMALMTLTGTLRAAVLVLLAGLAVKTWIADLKRKQELAEEEVEGKVENSNEGEDGQS